MTSQPNLVIRWEIEEIDKLIDGSVKESAIYTAAGLPWKIVAKKVKGSLHYYAHCNWDSEQTLWMCSATVAATTFHATKGAYKTDVMRKFAPGQAHNPFISFSSQHLEPAGGYVADGKVTVEFHISVNRTIGISERTLPDFAIPNHLTNVVLIVEGNKLHLSKEYLATHSPVFSAMFFGDFSEKNKEEIELHDVAYEEFLDLLHVIYLTEKEITASSVLNIITLADHYQMRSALKRAESYLMTSTKFVCTEKLQMADQFRLNDLSDHCLISLASVNEIGALKASPEYRNFSDAMKVAICDRFMDFF